MSVIQRNLAIGIVIALVLGVGIYEIHARSKSATVLPSGGQNSTSTTLTNTVDGVTGTGSYTVEQVGINPPSLDRPLTITATNLTADQQATLTTILEQQVAMLRKEPTRVDLWLQLGVDRKIAGDFTGAIEAWEYVSNVAPDDVRATAYGDLGDLYLYFIKDYAQAEENYKEAIRLSPQTIEYYRSLFYLYRDISKDPTKEAAILAQGLASNPNNPDLLQLQTQLKANTQ